MYKKFDDEVKEMKTFGHLMTPYNMPQASKEDEEIVNFIKAREAVVDGYSLILHYNRNGYEDHFVETLQVLGKFAPFLPFCLVCKIGKKFFGDKNLSLVQFYREDRKIYCWTFVTNLQGEPIQGPYPDGIEKCIYEGFEYRSLSADHVNLY